MKRETIFFDWYDLAIIVENISASEIEEYYEETPHIDIIDDFELISINTAYYNLEDQYVVNDIVIYKKSSNKYFKGRVTEIFMENTEYPNKLEEVFPKQKTITVYE